MVGMRGSVPDSIDSRELPCTMAPTPYPLWPLLGPRAAVEPGPTALQNRLKSPPLYLPAADAARLSRKRAVPVHIPSPAIVLDTNVVLDWLLFLDPAAAALASQLESGRLRWVATPAMRHELVSVLDRPMLRRRGTDSERILSMFDLTAEAWSVDQVSAAASGALRCRDPSDQKFVDLAIAVDARWLVTRDKALLELHRAAARHGLQVVTPVAWQPAPGMACPAPA